MSDASAARTRGSLRSHIGLGAALWTIGLFVVAGIVLTRVMARHPEAPLLFHAAFTHVVPLGLVAALALVAGLLQVRRGLGPFADLRIRLHEVREGRATCLEGDYPGEVAPLVAEVNALLADREARTARAQRKAGDLAHGLKTPLAVLGREAARAGTEGHPELAAAITAQVDRMRRQIDYQLAQARAAGGGVTGTARCDVAEVIDGLLRTMRALHADRDLTLTIDANAGTLVRAAREDLDEMLGNLLDNACKWARGCVRVEARRAGNRVAVHVDDDGPGVDPALGDAVLQRGVRADETAPGSGLGLAIVVDLVDLHAGSIALGTSPLGGLRVTLTLPAG